MRARISASWLTAAAPREQRRTCAICFGIALRSAPLLDLSPFLWVDSIKIRAFSGAPPLPVHQRRCRLPASTTGTQWGQSYFRREATAVRSGLHFVAWLTPHRRSLRSGLADEG